MAENDIYNNKKKYENIVRTLEDFLLAPEKRGNYKTKYYCKNKRNLQLFYIFHLYGLYNPLTNALSIHKEYISFFILYIPKVIPTVPIM